MAIDLQLKQSLSSENVRSMALDTVDELNLIRGELGEYLKSLGLIQKIEVPMSNFLMLRYMDELTEKLWGCILYLTTEKTTLTAEPTSLSN